MITRAVERALPACEARERPVEGLPRWWVPRAQRVIDFRRCAPLWARHRGTVEVDAVRRFVCEPYPWFKLCDSGGPSAAEAYPYVCVGDFADRVPASEIRDAQYLAAATGCDLLIERVAWPHSECIRLTFRPALLPDGRLSRAVKIAEWRTMVPEVENLLKRYYDEPKYV